MEFVFIILGVFLLCIFIYIMNSYQECFTNYTNKEIKTLSLTEIDKIKKSYEEIKSLYFKGFLVNSIEVNKEKDIIKNSIAKIANIVPNSSDKMNINNIYYGSTSDYGIRKYLNEINDKQFNDIILQLKNLSPNNDARNNEINNIINNYNDIKTLYTRTDNSNIYTSITSKKKAIESAFNNLKAIVSSKSDKQKIDIIYTEISMYLTTPNDAYFLPKLEELKLIAPNSLNDIDKIKSKYEEIKKINNSSSPEAITLKYDINKIILDIRNRAGDKSDIDKLDLIYYGEAKDNYGLIVYLDEIDENRFNILMKQLNTIINNLTDIVATKNSISDEIIDLFNQLNDLYKDVYINKITTYDIKKEEIENKNRLIYSKLLLLVPVNKLHSTEIVLILNTTLKRAYEINNITDINSIITSFKELVKNIVIKESTINTSSENTKTEVKGIIESRLGIPIEEQVIPLKITTQGIKDDFNNIYNSFDLLNTVFKNNYNGIINFNNTLKKQIDSYKAIIYGSLDNISKYYSKNADFINSVLSIKNVIIKPIIDKDLEESYKKKDEILISTIRTRFYKAINEIKNLIITNYGKTSTQININICLNNIIEAISNNKFPVKVSNINACHKSLFDNKDIIIAPKMFVSENNGIIWKPATELDSFKKTGINNNPYLYNYELASTSDNGINWNMIR